MVSFPVAPDSPIITMESPLPFKEERTVRKYIQNSRSLGNDGYDLDLCDDMRNARPFKKPAVLDALRALKNFQATARSNGSLIDCLDFRGEMIEYNENPELCRFVISSDCAFLPIKFS